MGWIDYRDDKQEMIRNEAVVERLKGPRVRFQHLEGEQPVSRAPNKTNLLLQLIDNDMGTSALT
jgi:hypothetical protein